jgi:hypothetical protein
MRINSLFLLAIVLLFSTCKDKEVANNELMNTDEKLTLEGTWELVSRYNYVDNKVSDSFGLDEGYRQVKMYSPTKVMWSRTRPADSTEWFGYGSYEINPNNDRLTEVLDYGSIMMSQIIEEEKEFVFELDLKENSFIQIELDDDGNRVISENYIRIE